jgi:hypothetical protein
MQVNAIEFVPPPKKVEAAAEVAPSPQESSNSPAPDSGADKAVVVSISPEAAALAQKTEALPPKERSTPRADMELARALDGVDMDAQEGREATESAEPQTRTTDPMVIAQAVMAS